MIQLKKLGEVCYFVRGPFGGSLKKSCFVENGYAVYEQQHAIYDQFSEIRYFVDGDKFNELKRFELKPNDLIMSCSGTMGRVAIVPENVKKGIINQALLKLTPKKNLDVQYLKYWMKSPDFNERIQENTVGAAIKNVASVKILKQIQIPVPPLPEQKQIVVLLDQAFAAIDKAKANIEKNIANAKELFQSKLNEIFSQKGEGWEEKTLGEVCENLDSKRIPITKSKRKSGNIPYYGASGIVDYVADYIFDENLLLVSEDGANLLARTYPIAFSISGKTWVNNHAHAIKFQNMTSQIFIEYYLNSIKLDDYISGMAQPKLNQRMLNSIPIPFPSIVIQEKIVNTIKKLSSQNKNLIVQYEQKIISLEELKKSILQKAFAGELTMSETMVESD
tara:strand:- start:4280 stop:5452 length:1173 start_codon:yes stop_codon:yes gene_type:complete